MMFWRLGIVCLILRLSVAIPSPEPWYGDFLGPLPDPQNVGIRGDVYVVNDTCVQILGFSYNASAPDLYFWADTSFQPTADGIKIPTFEFGSHSLHKYNDARVVLVLPGDYKVYNVRSIGLWCEAYSKNFGHVVMRADLKPPRYQLMKEKLHGDRYGLKSGPIAILDRRRLKVFAFEFYGDQAPDGFFMVGKGVEPSHKNGIQVPVRGRDTPELITALKERYSGGKDLIIDLPESHNVYNIDYLSVYCYQYPKDFGHIRIGNVSDRIPPFVPLQKRLTDTKENLSEVWPATTLVGTTARTTFTFQLGPPGGRRAYKSLARMMPSEYVWYVNGYMSPVLILKRGITYTFNVEGGMDASTELFINPLYISDEPYGGYMKLKEDERKQLNVFAGLNSANKPMKGDKLKSAGRLCKWKQKNSKENADLYDSFADYKKTLTLECRDGAAGVLRFTPDRSTPDKLYYQSYTSYNMGYRIEVVDELPEDVQDFTEEPYRYEIWLQHNSAVGTLPKGTKAASSVAPISAAVTGLLMLALVRLFST